MADHWALVAAAFAQTTARIESLEADRERDRTEAQSLRARVAELETEVAHVAAEAAEAVHARARTQADVIELTDRFLELHLAVSLNSLAANGGTRGIDAAQQVHQPRANHQHQQRLIGVQDDGGAPMAAMAPDHAKAAQVYQLGANLGHADSMYMLAGIHTEIILFCTFSLACAIFCAWTLPCIVCLPFWYIILFACRFCIHLRAC